MPGPAAPGTRLPGTDGATVEDLIRRRAERAIAKQKRINLALRKRINLALRKRNNSVNKKLKRKSHIG